MDRICFISLGCDKNLVDSEKMLALLAGAGYELTDNEWEAEIIVINTCCFITPAKEESIQAIIDMGAMKEEGHCRCLIVTGCLAQRYADDIRKDLPEVDAVIGTTSYDALLEVIDGLKKAEGLPLERLDSLKKTPRLGPKRIMTTGGHYEYLKIAEGCSKWCSYCVIPSVRGPYRSAPMEELVGEAEALAKKGVTELILVAQETTLYGTDLYGEKKLPELLHELCGIEGIRKIRLLYCYPEEITEELLETIAGEEKVCRYIDMPIQHCSDRILKLMGRRTTKAEITEKIRLIRKILPDMTIRTTVLTGFPGETAKEHEELLSFIRETRFDRLGCFAYSQEEGTKAARMEGQIDEDEKERRLDEIMTCQQEVAFEKAKAAVGTEMTVMVEGRMRGDDLYICRGDADAPEVDNYVFVPADDDDLMTGTYIDVIITDAQGYDLIGERKNESAE